MPFLSLPDGTSMKVPEGISEDAAFKLARDKYPEAFPEYAEHEKKTGLVSATKAGFKSGAGSALEGLGNLFGSQDLAGYGKDVQQTAGQEYEPTTEADIGVGRRQGITSLLGKGISKYITEPVGQAVGSVAGRYGAPIASGTAAGVLAPEGAILGAGASALAFAATNFPIHFGEDISAQKNAGKEVDYGKALIPAMVQTAVDSLGGAIVGGAMKGIALKTATQEAQLLAPKVLSGLLKPEEATAQISGKLMSIVKGTAEAAGAGTLMSTVGQAGQRVAAGQDVFSPEALDEYTHAAKEMGLVAPFFGMLHAGQPARAKRLIDEARAKGEAQRTGIAREQQAGVIEEHYASPEGQAQLHAEREPIIQQMNDIKELLKAKDLPKDQKKEGKTRLDELQKQLEEINKRPGVENAPTAEVAAPATLEQRLEALRTKRAEDAAAQEEVLQQARTGLNLGEDVEASPLKNAPSTLTVREKEAQAKELDEHRTMLTNSIPRMENMIDNIQKQLDEAIGKGDTQTYRNLVADRAKISDALEAAKKQQEALPKRPEEERTALEKEVKDLTKEASKYTGPAFDQAKVDKIIDRLETAKKRLAELPEPEQENLFAPKQKGLEFEETPEEKAYAAKQAELEETFATQTPEYITQNLLADLKKQAEERGQPMTADVLEENNQRISRIVKAIKEAQENEDPATAQELMKRLGLAKEKQAIERPEGRRDKALEDQQTAISNLRDAIEDIKTGRYLGGGKDVKTAESMRSGLETKAEQAKTAYIDAAIRDVEAKREASRTRPSGPQMEKAFSKDEKLKLAFELQEALDNAIKNKNLAAVLRPGYAQQLLKVKDNFKLPNEEITALRKLAGKYNNMMKENNLTENLSQLEKQLAGIKNKYLKGERNVEAVKPEFALEAPGELAPKLSEAAIKQEIKNVPSGFGPRNVTRLKEVQASLEDFEKATPSMEVANRVAELKKEEKELLAKQYRYIQSEELGIFETPRKDIVADLKQRQADIKERKAPVDEETFASIDDDIVTLQEQLKTATGEAAKGIKKDIARLEEAKIDVTKFGEPKQGVLPIDDVIKYVIIPASKEGEAFVPFAKREKELVETPFNLRTERATPKNFMRFVNAQKQKFAKDKAVIGEALVKDKDWVARHEPIIRKLETVNLALENNGMDKAPPLYLTVEEAQKRYDNAVKTLATPDESRTRAAQKFITKTDLQASVNAAKKVLDQAISDKERLPAAKIKQLIDKAKERRDGHIKRFVKLNNEKYKLLQKLGLDDLKVTKPLTEAEIARANHEAIIDMEVNVLEDAVRTTKAVAESRSNALRKFFTAPIESKMLENIDELKLNKAYHEAMAKWYKTHKNTKERKFASAHTEYAKKVGLDIEAAEAELGKVRSWETDLFLQEKTNNDSYIKQTRKRLKTLLARSETTPELFQAKVDDITRAEAKADADLQKRIAKRRIEEQKRLEVAEDVPKTITGEEQIGTLIYDLKKYYKIKNRIEENELLFQKLLPGLEARKQVEKKLKEDRSKLESLKEPIMGRTVETVRSLKDEEATKKELGYPSKAPDFAARRELSEELEGLRAPKEETAKAQQKAVRTATVLGDQPGKAERKKPLKTGPEIEGRPDLEKAKKSMKKTFGEFAEVEKIEKEMPREYDASIGFNYKIDTDDFGNVFRLGSKEKSNVNLKETKRLAEDFKAKLPEGVKFEYADTAVELPDYVRRQISKEEADTMKGVVLKDGTIAVVGDKHLDMLDFEKTLAHEAVGHYGVDRLLGLEGLAKLAERIEAQPGGFIRMSKEMGVLNDVVAAIKDARKSKPNLTPKQEMMVGVREMIAHFEEQRLDNRTFLQNAKRFIKTLLGQFRDWLRKNNLMELSGVKDGDLLYLLKQSREAMSGKGGLRTGDIGLEPAFRKSTPTDKSDPRFLLSEALVAKPKTLKEKAQGNLVAFNTQFVDRLAPLKEIFRREGEKGPVLQMMYNLLAHGQRTNVTSEIVANGARSFVRDPITGEITIKSAGGPGGKDIVAALLESKAGNPQALNEMFTGYVAAKRANNVGYEKLVRDGEINGVKITRGMLAAAEKAGDADPAFVKAFETYQKYNNGLVDMLAESGTISKDKAAQLKSKNYIPYYRSRGGVVDLVIGNEAPIRIGSLKDQPYLHELAGGEEKIQDFFKSMVANTNMITEMTLRNNATSSVANTLQGLGIAEVRKGSGQAGPDVIRFKSNGKDYHAVIDTSKNAEFSDISPQLLVKGMEGIPTQLPGIVKMLGVPANWLRKGVVRNPFYAYKQLVRDPISAWLTTGANFTPILSSLKEVNRALRGGSETAKRLQEAGILGGEVFTGRAEDLHQIVTHLESGKISFNGAMTLLDKMATEADASTRSVLYDSLRKQGLTDMQAQIATMESMNFNTRGASPSMHWMNTMVPFFNSAIQGYNVMYKAFTGKMPFAKQLELQNKLIKRGSLIAGMSILYAIANQDTEAYKNATPDQRYLNWIIPGMGKEGKEGFRLPIPFEAGYIFKAFPEALVNLAYSDDKAREGLDAIKAVVNASTPSVIPTAIKAPLEMAMNKSLFTGQDIESKRLLAMEPGQRAYDNTSEAAKQLGAMLNVSPVQIDYLARNYFGGIYTTISSLVNPAIVDSANVKPEGTMSDLPVFGQMFQPQDAGGITQRAYQVMEKASQKSATFKHITDTGDEKKAQEYLKANEAEIGVGESASTMRAQLDQINGAIRALKEQRLPTGMAPAEFAVQKRQQLDQLLQARAQMAKDFTATLAETKRQSSR